MSKRPAELDDPDRRRTVWLMNFSGGGNDTHLRLMRSAEKYQEAQARAAEVKRRVERER